MVAYPLSRGRKGKFTAALLALCALSTRLEASEPNAQRVNHFVGAAGESLAIQVPPFHGLEPRLGLSYSSEAPNGFAGMGWDLTGFSVIERVNGAWGLPRFDSSDVFTLDGQTLLACQAGSSYPSCAYGGTHYTHQESYLKVKRVSETLWEVYGKDGTRTEFAPLYSVGAFSLRLGQSKAVDTHGNTVNYNWVLNAGGVNGATYPASVAYNGFTIEFFREIRPDGPRTRATYSDVARLPERLKSVVVRLSGGAKIRAYKLSYTPSAATSKSLLTSVHTYGRDAVVDGSGNITSGTSLPAQSFAYQGDAAAATFTGDAQMSNAGPPATVPGTVENVVWSLGTNTTTTGDGSTLTAAAIENGWDKNGSSTRGLSSGLGYVEFDMSHGQTRNIYFGQHMLTEFSATGGEYVHAYGPSGYLATWVPVPAGAKLRIEIVAGGVQFKINGVSFASATQTVSYPMQVGGQLYGGGDSIVNVRLSGSLVNLWGVDCGGSPRFPGDFNGDGRQDSVCRTAAGGLAVTLATQTGFSSPTIWGSWGDSIRGVGDFNNDGRDDIVFFDSYWGDTYVGLSDGVDFGAITYWGNIDGNDYAGFHRACRMNGATLGKVADYNGDGKLDISCYIPGGDEEQHQFVGLSTGASFSSSLFSTAGCSQPYGNTALQDQADFNGDGREDWFCTDTYNGDVMTFFSAGSFFWWGQTILSGFCSPNEYSFGDWNGDGTTDAACANSLRTGLHTGSIFAVLEAPVPAPYCVSGQRLAADLDGDGAAEWICNNPGTPANDIEVRRWNGLAFGPVQTWRGGFCGGYLKAADFNGDGKKDLLCESSGAVIYAGTKNLKADLLTLSANGIGGTSTLAYTTTTQHLTNSTAGLRAKYIVASTTASDGHTTTGHPTSATTTFLYSTGIQNDAERKFFGFQTVTESLPKLPAEPVSPGIVRKFRIDTGAAGSLEEVARYDGQSKILSKTKHEYTTTETTGSGARRTTLLSATWNYQYSGLSGDCSSWPCGDGKRTKTEFTYGSTFGNLLSATNFGEVGALNAQGVEYPLSGDETMTQYEYKYNTTAYIVGLLARERQWSGTTTAGALLTQNRIAYDGASSWITAPTKGDATRREAWLNTESRYLSSTAGYDSYGNVTSSMDPTGKTASATYDATYHVFPVSSTNGANETASTTWDYLCGVPLTTTDPNSVTATFATDALCRPTTTTLPSPYGVVETRSYSNLGSPTTQKARVETPGPDGANDWSESYFDGFGRTYQTAKRGPSAAQPIYRDADFDLRGNLASQTAPYYEDETPKFTKFEYDRYDRRTKTTLPDLNTRLSSYPALSADGFFQSIQTNELDQSSTTKFDVFGRTREIDQSTPQIPNVVTTRNYDVLGRMTSLVDPGGNTWTYTYDSLGRNLTKVDPDSGTWVYTYDDASRVLSQKDAKLQTTTLEYDLVGRPQYKRIRPTGGPSGTITETVETAYGTSAAAFNRGRVSGVVTKTGTTGPEMSGKLAFEYDALGRVTKQTRTLDGTNYAVERNYDTAGYLRGMKYPDNDTIGQFGGSGTALGYDTAGRLSSIPGILSSVTYSALGAPLVQTNANGTTTTKTYDADRFWLTDIDTMAPSLTLQNLHYTLNYAGMATAVDSDVTNEDWTYAYDAMNRLTSSTNGVGANSQTWTYDSLGRFTANSRVGTTFTYPSAGNARPHAPTQISGGPLGLLTFSYDANGNMLSGNGRTMTWSPANQITQVGANSTTTTFTYGPDGDRIEKTQGGTVVRYPFGDDYEINGSTVTKYFNAGFGVIAKKVGTSQDGLYWLHTDRMGSINTTTAADGAEVLRRSYRSYGELFGQTGTHTESLGYIGQRTDAETANGTTDDKGLTYLHARYYDSALGIFLSPDPARADRNTYRYSHNNPTNRSDPSGLTDSWCNASWTYCEVYPGGDTSGYGQIEGLGDGADDRRNRDQEQREREAEKGLCLQADGTMGKCSVGTTPDDTTCEELGNCPVKTCQELGNCPKTNQQAVEDLVKHVLDPPFGPNTLERSPLDARHQSNPCNQSTFSRTVENFGILNSLALGGAIQTASDVTGFLLGVGVPLVGVGLVDSAVKYGAWTAVETGVIAAGSAASIVSGGLLAAEGGLFLASFHEAKQVRVNYGCYLQ